MTDLRVQPRRKWPWIVGVILAALAGALAIGLHKLDADLTSRARDQADQMARRMGRPVTLGAVETHFLSGLAVRVTDLKVGALADEGAPLLQVSEVEVKAELLRAIRSRGKDIEVTELLIRGLQANVVRLRDGTTNVERMQKAMADSAPPEKPKADPAEPDKPTDLSAVRIDRAELQEARIAFLDQAAAGKPAELAISHLGVLVTDLRAGKPLAVTVKAAVLDAKENLELVLHAAPLPATLVPTPTELTLKMQPVDLQPLAPFIPASVGLLAGKFQADLAATLGAAVAGGSGPSHIAGVLRATGLRFQGAEGGKALDVDLDTDVKGDASKGDVQIDKLHLALGPVVFEGHGKASGLNSPAPQVQGLEIVSRNLDLGQLSALYPPLGRALGGQIRGPILFRISGSGSQGAQALEWKVDLAGAHIALKDQLDKAAGAPMSLTGHLKGAAATGGPMRFDAQVDLAGADLRPGKSLNKAPGQPLSVSLNGTRSTGGSAAAPEQKIEIADLEAKLLADTLSGKGSVEMKGAGARKTTRFELQLRSAHLDLDKLLIPTEPKDKKPLDPKTFAGMSGDTSVHIDALRVQKSDLTNVDAQVRLAEDLLTVERATFGIYGGTASANGTSVRLAHPHEPLHIMASVKGMDLATALTAATPRKILGGKFDGSVDLTAGGQDKKELLKTLAGALKGDVRDGVFYGKDLIASVAGPLRQALPSQLAGKVTDGGRTDLGKLLPLGILFENGTARLKDNLTVQRPEAALSFGGGVSLDGILNMPGTVTLAPDTIAALTGGKVHPSQAIPVNLRLSGPAWSPSIGGLDLKPAVQAILQQAGSALLGKALGKTGLPIPANIPTSTDAAKQQAEQAVRAKAQSEADQAKQKAQDAAKDKLKGLFGH